MRKFLERARQLGIEIGRDYEELADLMDLERDVGEDYAMWEDALRPTFLHDVILDGIREAIHKETERLKCPKLDIDVAV